MAIRDLAPWKWGRKDIAPRGEDNPFLALQRQMNSLFDEFFRGSDLAPFREFGAGLFGDWRPRVDVKETGKELAISVELPGLDEKDIEVSLTEDLLTIRGEKKAAAEEEKDSYHRLERSYGAFERTIGLPAGIDPEKVEASFKNGVLTVTLPKLPEAQANARKIAIKKE